MADAETTCLLPPAPDISPALRLLRGLQASAPWPLGKGQRPGSREKPRTRGGGVAAHDRSASVGRVVVRLSAACLLVPGSAPEWGPDTCMCETRRDPCPNTVTGAASKPSPVTRQSYL